MNWIDLSSKTLHFYKTSPLSNTSPFSINPLSKIQTSSKPLSLNPPPPKQIPGTLLKFQAFSKLASLMSPITNKPLHYKCACLWWAALANEWMNEWINEWINWWLSSRHSWSLNYPLGIYKSIGGLLQHSHINSNQ